MAFTVQGVSAGSSSVTVTIIDSKEARDTRTVSVTVNTPPPSNNAPTFTLEPLLTYSIAQGDSDVVILQYSDPDGDPVELILLTNPTGIITAVPIVGQQQFTIQGVAQGTTNLTIRLSDGKGGITNRVASVTVTAPAAPPPPEGTETP
jgi:uncharacterized protein YjdB